MFHRIWSHCGQTVRSQSQFILTEAGLCRFLVSVDADTKRRLRREPTTVPELEVELKPKGGPFAISYSNLYHLPREREREETRENNYAVIHSEE